MKIEEISSYSLDLDRNDIDLLENTAKFLQNLKNEMKKRECEYVECGEDTDDPKLIRIVTLEALIDRLRELKHATGIVQEERLFEEED